MRVKGLRRAICTLICVAAFQSISAQVPSALQSDNQQWTDVLVAVPLSKAIDFNFGGTLRLGRDINRPVDERVGFGLTFRVGKYLTLSPNYLYIGMQPIPRRRVWETRLSLPVLVKFKAGRFTISDRNTFERRLRFPINSTRYRNRLQIEHPIGSDKTKWSVFVSDEVFYDWLVNDWVRNRIQIGASRIFNKHFTQDYYYLRQNDGRSVPGDLNVIGTTLRFRL
jgi:hypothetical protein